MTTDLLLTLITFFNVINIVWLYSDTLHLKHEIKRLRIEHEGAKNVST